MNSRKYKMPSDTKYNYYYDAYCYLGKRLPNINSWDTRWLTTLSLSNYHDLEEASGRMKWKYFNELVTVSDTSGVSVIRFNINDKRFWEGPAWKMYYQ
jgi:hypothetical protein